MVGGSILRVHLRNLTPRSWRCSAISTAATPDVNSEVFEASRKMARPATVTWSEQLHNSVSLIGTVEYPLKQFDLKDGKYGATTTLLVKPSPTCHAQFRVTLSVWDLLAETALAHLKPNDYIHVSGQLGSYTKSTSEGTERMYYKVTATELSYVKVPDENYQVAVKSGSKDGESGEQKHDNRLHMLDLLFANPEEWYDNRKTKKNPRQPDFKHKSTGEVLWLNAFDPPWVKKQVELLDCKVTGRSGDEVPFGSFASHCDSDVQLDSSNSTVTATELSYVKVPDENDQVAVKSGSEAGESGEQKHNNQHQMWQLYFANPEEWYDNWKTKKDPREPDFKHKSTGEELWLNAFDSPWVKKQVELLDSKLAGQSGDEVPSGLFASHWDSDVQLDSSNSTVTAPELGYVKVPDENYQVAVKSGSKAGESGAGEQKCNNRLHMLDLLFANPDEWYDNRKTKKNPRQPDFKHKRTGEALWLHAYDPPWVKKQVELLDSKLAGRSSDEAPFGSFASDVQFDSSITPRNQSY